MWFLVGVLLGPLGILLAAIGAKDDQPSGGVGIGAADEVAKLADLRDRGILTPEEFERQKAALLARSPQRSAQTSQTARYLFYAVVGLLVVVILWMLLQIA